VRALYAVFRPPTEIGEYVLCCCLESYARIVALCMAGDAALTGVLNASGVDAVTGCLPRPG
jgi:hypothetical protein